MHLEKRNVINDFPLIPQFNGFLLTDPAKELSIPYT